MNDAPPTPTSLQLDVKENLLRVTWADGHVSLYDGAYLRYVCPCAMCRGHAPGEVDPPRWADVASVRATGAEAVGTYAVRFTFTDGHETGIYTWTWLREVCPSERQGCDERGRPKALEPDGGEA